MAQSSFKVQGIYSSGMVLQRNATNCIFGKANPNSPISMEFRGKKENFQSDSKGNWKIEYNAGKEGGPFTLKLLCNKELIEYTDVYVGDVWISSGQSNAELPMERMKYSYPDEFALPENANIRMIHIPISWSFDGEKQSVENPTWLCANKENLSQMSGTAYFFAKQLNKSLNIPIGIINASQGGSPIESWMNKKCLEDLAQNESLSRLKIYESPENIKNKQAEVANSQQKWDQEVRNSCNYEDAKNCENWKTVNIPNDFSVKSAGITWFKKEINLTRKQVQNFNAQTTNLWLGTIVDADTVYINDVQVGITYYCYPPRRYIVPSGVLKEGKNTIIVKVQKNSKYGKIRFYKDKPYALFTDDVFVMPRTIKNIEKINYEPKIPYNNKKLLKTSTNSEYINLCGKWQKKEGSQTSDAPAGMFFEWVPTALYNSMLAPCFNYALSGAIWYQGESNAMSPNEYKILLPKMIELWRQKFVYAKNDFPFVVMQLPSWCDGNINPKEPELNGGWGAIRQAQKDGVNSVKNASLAIAIDAGEWNDLHPETKRTCGTRAAKVALKNYYNKEEKEEINLSPDFVSLEQKKGILHTNLFVKFNSKLCVINHSCINGFYVVYNKDDKDFTKRVKAVLQDDFTVKVTVAKKLQLKELRYLYEDNIDNINLYSKDKQFPAEPFCVICNI